MEDADTASSSSSDDDNGDEEDGAVMDIAELAGRVVLESWLDEVRAVGRMSMKGVSQLVADAGYLKNVYSALGLGNVEVLEDVRDLGGGEREDVVKGKEGKGKIIVMTARGVVGGGDGLS